MCNEVSISAAHRADAAQQSTKWILHPLIDILFCCGGLVWLLFAAHYFVAVPMGNPLLTQTLALVGILSVHALSETHNAATLFRAYKTEETRNRFAFSTKWAALACGALFLSGLLVPGVTAWMSRIYLVWVVQHFTAQTYGLTLVYCYKNNFSLSRFEKASIAALLNCTAVMAVIRSFTYEEWSGNGFLAQNLPEIPLLPEWIFLCTVVTLKLAVAVFAGVVLRKALIERKIIPFPAVMLCTTGVLIYVLGRDTAQFVWLYAPAFYHGSQYLAISFAHHVKEQGKPERTLAFKYFAFLLIAAAFMYIGLPRLLQECGIDYALAFATVFCAINLHHFVTDMTIWKLRDPKLRKAIAS